MHKIAAMVAMLVLIAASGCSSSAISFIPPISDGMKTYEQFVSSKSFPYTIPQERKAKIERNYNNLKLGMTKKDISSMLGDPDFSTYMHTKEYPRKFIGSEWTYYFYKPKSNLVNEKLDRGVFVFFGTTDKAEWIVPQNIDGLAEKGGPRRTDR
jgi:outer membrane protein assembly factor BamE (lipoprotein component of BamABCDE complex)